MFSGIVETLGRIMAIENESIYIHLTIHPLIAFDDLKIGDSVAINGVCLTVTALSTETFSVTIVPETKRLTNLGTLKSESYVNLERSLPAQGRIGGHYVQGHVDAIGHVTHLALQDEVRLTIAIPKSLTQYIVKKGYITVDGMSLTVVDVSAEHFSIALIPHTQQVTVAQFYQPGTLVNIEVDILSKYVEKLLGVRSHDHGH